MQCASRMTDNERLTLTSDLDGASHDLFLRDENDLSIAELIPRILAERSSFINLTEDQLRQEIEDDDFEEENEDEETEVAEDNLEANGETAHQTFQRQKGELLTNINSAMNEVSLSLDFVSLLMSALKPTVAKATMSPHLTKIAPLGSLGSDRLTQSADEPLPRDHARQSAEKIGRGWKHQALGRVTSLFQEAALQLREQVNHEKKYWDLINTVLSHDEVLFKVKDPLTNLKAIGVKYGYGDSGSSYFDKGLAVLRKDETSGEISFNPIAAGNNKVSQRIDRYTRVRILSKIDNDFMLTGQSVFDKEAIKKTREYLVLNDIKRARFFLFEEDLFYHLIREAKFLINYHVTIIANKVIVELHDQIIEIEAVPYDENNEAELENVYQNVNDESSKNNDKAQAILSFLKIMLCCYYQYNLDLRQRVPTSFTKWKQSNSHPLMLRPLIGLMRHELHVRKAQHMLNGLCRLLDTSKFNYDIDEKKFLNLKLAAVVKNPFSKAVTKPLSEVTATIKKNTGSRLEVKIEISASDIFVNLLLKMTVTQFHAEEEQDTKALELRFTDWLEIEESLSWVIMRFEL